MGCCVSFKRESKGPPAAQVPTTPAARGSALGARVRSTNDVSAVSARGDEAEQPACFSGESNDSHAEHQARGVASTLRVWVVGWALPPDNNCGVLWFPLPGHAFCEAV